MSYADSTYARWSDRDWKCLVESCEELGAPEKLVRQIALSYMHRGSGGGGNRHGLIGTYVAMRVDEVNAARSEELGVTQ